MKDDDVNLNNMRLKNIRTLDLGALKREDAVFRLDLMYTAYVRNPSDTCEEKNRY